MNFLDQQQPASVSCIRIAGISVTEISFSKYDRKGAYHWRECFGPVHRLNAFTLGRYQMVLTALRAHGLLPNSCVLDVGCGDGALSGLLAMHLRARIDGIDVVPLAIELAQAEFAKRKLDGRFHLIDGYAYPFRHSNFSASCLLGCHRARSAAREDASRDVAGFGSGTGVLVVTTPVRYTEQPLDPMHVQEWFPKEFESLCSAALGVPVAVQLSHPIAFAELYGSPSVITGKITRLVFNVLSKAGRNPFLRQAHLRAFAAQTAVAKKRS